MIIENRAPASFAGGLDVIRALSPSEPVYCLRPGIVRARAARFLASFPGRVLYAVKCNPHPVLIAALVEGGIDAFDTASPGEIDQIREGWPGAACYFMNPVKARPAIRAARRAGVRAFALDHPDELAKLADELGRDPEVAAVVRLRTDARGEAVFHLDSKFGAPPDLAVTLLGEAAARGFRPGLAFHVGSQCLSPEAYTVALAQAGQVIDRAGVAPACLDIGGGFPAPYAPEATPPLESFLAAIRAGLAALDLPPGCQVLAEPGRALVAEGASLLLQVQLRKGSRLYLNDGVFGGLGELAAAKLCLTGRVLRPGGEVTGPLRVFDAAGPTCDSLDVMPGLLRLPETVREGDWIELPCMGAYSSALTSHFNGFGAARFITLAEEGARAAA